MIDLSCAILKEVCRSSPTQMADIEKRQGLWTRNRGIRSCYGLRLITVFQKTPETAFRFLLTYCHDQFYEEAGALLYEPSKKAQDLEPPDSEEKELRDVVVDEAGRKRKRERKHR